MRTPKMLFNVSSMDKWDLVFAKIENFIDDNGGPLFTEVRVLADGAAVWGCLGQVGQNHLARLKKFHDMGVVFAVCARSLKACDIDESIVLTGIFKIVSAGVSFYESSWNVDGFACKSL
jgi:intracellular sulfur oxidation DsrE/DsrF family protein